MAWDFAGLVEQFGREPRLLDDGLERLRRDGAMLRHGDIARDAVDDRPVSAMAAALPDLDESLALENTIDLPWSQDSHR